MKQKYRIIKLMICLIIFLLPSAYCKESNCGQFRFAHLIHKNLSGFDVLDINGSESGVLKIFFQPIKKVNFYLLLITPDHNMKIIYSPDDSATKPQTTEKIFIASEKDWFEESGKYSLLYIFGENRLKDLEKNIDEYKRMKVTNSGTESVYRLLSLVRQMRRDSELVSNINDLPVPVVGTFRNDKEEPGEDLLRLYFSEAESPGSQNSMNGISEDIKTNLQAAAESIEFCDVYINEVIINYHD